MNDTRKDLATEYEFDYLYVESTVQTSAGSARYVLPPDFLGFETVWLGTKKLERLYLAERDTLADTVVSNPGGEQFLLPLEQGLDPNYRGPSDYYVIRGFEIELWPIPDATYTLKLKYYAQPADFVTNSEYDYISNFHFDAIIWGAALRGAIYLDDEAKVAKYENYYRQAVQKMILREKMRAAKDLRPRLKSYRDYYLTTFKRMMKVIPMR